jgi:hypothetical protein
MRFGSVLKHSLCPIIELPTSAGPSTSAVLLETQVDATNNIANTILQFVITDFILKCDVTA